MTEILFYPNLKKLNIDNNINIVKIHNKNNLNFFSHFNVDLGDNIGINIDYGF